VSRGVRTLASVVVVAIVGGTARIAVANAPAAATERTAAEPRQSAVARRFALVIGTNRALKPGLVTLRYADDDAVRWATLFHTFGADVEILTTLDAESERLYGVDAPAHRDATRAEMTRAMTRLRSEIAKARDAGARTTFYFVYAGHGDEEAGEGFVALADGRLLRREIQEQIIGASGADTNHVIIDACRSYYIAYDRGPGGSRRPWLDPYFRTGTSAHFRNTGFLLGSSSGGETHEWEEFQSGIFSHEVRSGLLGGADIDGDGRITYGEIAAFVRVANQAVRNVRYRPEILARAPSNGDDVLLDVRDATGGRVRLPAGQAGRHLLEDGLGVRWADIHPGPRQNVTLALPSRQWGRELFFMGSVADNTEYRLEGGVDVDLADVKPQPRGVLPRGAIHQAFAQLFALPFDVRALTALPDPEPPNALSDVGSMRADNSGWTTRSKRVAAAGAGIGSIAAFAVTGGLVWSALGIQDRAEGENGQVRAALDEQITDRNRWAVGTATGGVVLAAAAAALFIWDRASKE
jgi:hypothetical protein